ncbi:MAG: hypothetical protein ABI613_04775 [Gemmatimonadota bacterium]
MTRESLHLTVDDLDALLDGHLDLIKIRHIEVCDDCRDFARAEQQLAARLAALPLFSPGPGFSERVMVAVRPAHAPRVPGWQRARDRVFASRRSLALAASVAVAVVGSMGASVAWSLSHQDTMAAAGQWLGSQAGQALWVTLQGIASNLFEQPWYGSVRSFVGSPERLAVVSGSLSLAYLTGVLTLRRLLMAPTSGLVRANA